MPENKSENTIKTKGISIRKLNYIMAAMTLVVSIVLIVVSYKTLSLYKSLSEKTDICVEGQKTAQEMQIASDYLTEQVRCFVESGDRAYLDDYFEEFKVTRRREKALEELGRTFDGTVEYEALEEAEKQSMALMETEYYAMRLTVEAYGYDLSGFPDEIKNVAVSEADSALSGRDKKEKARQMVFDDNYHLQKSIISSKTQECLNRIIGKLHEQQCLVAGQFGVMIRVEQVMIILLIVIVLLIVTLTTIQVIAPLIRAIPHIREDKPIPIDGAEEFRYLANTYNRIYEENKCQKEELAYEASHDQLTGAFNRKGFEELLQTADHVKTAMLLIDVDRFKRINDTYGHAEGDKALARLTSVLVDYFGEENTICRIGGDEFVMFITGAGIEQRETIERKIKEINGELQKGGENVPPMSVSVGIAFGENEDGMAIYKKADIALYKVKENGRAGCVFYE